MPLVLKKNQYKSRAIRLYLSSRPKRQDARIPPAIPHAASE